MQFGFWLISRWKREFGAAAPPSLPGVPTICLVTSGTFVRARNSNYLGAMPGGAVAMNSPWLLLTSAVAVLILDFWRIRPEERHQAGVFGDDCDAANRGRVSCWV